MKTLFPLPARVHWRAVLAGLVFLLMQGMICSAHARGAIEQVSPELPATFPCADSAVKI